MKETIAEEGEWLWALAKLYEGHKITCSSWERGKYEEKALPDFVRMEQGIIKHYSFFDEFEWESESVFSSYDFIDLSLIEDWYVLEEIEVSFPEIGIPNRTYFSDARKKKDEAKDAYYKLYPERLLEKFAAVGSALSSWTRDRLRETCIVDLILGTKPKNILSVEEISELLHSLSPDYAFNVESTLARLGDYSLFAVRKSWSEEMLNEHRTDNKEGTS